MHVSRIVYECAWAPVKKQNWKGLLEWCLPRSTVALLSVCSSNSLSHIFNYAYREYHLSLYRFNNQCSLLTCARLYITGSAVLSNRWHPRCFLTFYNDLKGTPRQKNSEAIFQTGLQTLFSCFSQRSLSGLQVVQNAKARLKTRTKTFDHTTMRMV